MALPVAIIAIVLFMCVYAPMSRKVTNSCYVVYGYTKEKVGHILKREVEWGEDHKIGFYRELGSVVSSAARIGCSLDGSTESKSGD